MDSQCTAIRAGDRVRYRSKLGRIFLGTVRGIYSWDGGERALVEHFNSEPWPFDPPVEELYVLDGGEVQQ